MGRLSGPHRNRPTRQFFLNLSGNGRSITRNNKLLMFDLFCDSGFLDEHADVITGKFAGCPGGHHRKPFGIFDQQLSRNPATFDFTGNDKVRQRKIGGDQYR